MTMKTVKERGFTLIEMMLVAVVIAMFFGMLIGYTSQRARTAAIDRASQQMQQILNAGLSYYISHGEWPADLATLQTPVPYVPADIRSPWNTEYTVTPIAPVPPANVQFRLLQVTMPLPAGLAGQNAIAAVLAGKLPYGAVTVVSGSTAVTATVNIPGQNLNNATAVNFSGMYRNSACVPVPACPGADASGTPMEPKVIVTPAQISGVNDAGTANVYPLTSFTAYVTGPSAAPGSPPPACSPGGRAVCDATAVSPTGLFWRVCIDIVTSKGRVTLDATTARYVAAMAMTRCAVTDEASGDPFNIFSP